MVEDAVNMTEKGRGKQCDGSKFCKAEIPEIGSLTKSRFVFKKW